MTPARTVVFVCPHGAAKSVLAAAYFQRLADARGARLRAVVAGTEPDPEVAPGVAAALLAEGLDVQGLRPRRVTADELAAARRVVSLGADLESLARPGLLITRWDDVPSMTADLGAARERIAARVAGLLDELTRTEGRP